MQLPHEVDYDRLVTEYQDSLVSMLRGFRTGPDFLEAWVPNDDHLEAILTIFDAAAEAALPLVRVVVSTGTLAAEDDVNLRRTLPHYGKLSVAVEGARTAYLVELEPGRGRPSARRRGASRRVAARGQRPTGSAPTGPAEGTGHERSRYDDGMSPYVVTLQELGGTEARSGAAGEPPPGCVTVEHQAEGVQLSAWIALDDHTVRRARHCGAPIGAQSRLLDLLCVLLEGRPLQEGSDHVVGRLEHQLRGRAVPVPGIVTPNAADSLFELAQLLVRGLAGDYRVRTGYRQKDNTYHEAPSRRWSAMTLEDRVSRVTRAIEGVPARVPARLLEIDEANRAFIELDAAASERLQQAYLMNLEEHLQHAVEPTLQVFLRPRDDRNKLRRAAKQP